jgi:hypothetical protein
VGKEEVQKRIIEILKGFDKVPLEAEVIILLLAND